MAHFGFPYRVDGRGRTADASDSDHIRQLIEQLLFTAPGERINRPGFGTALRQLVFSPASDELASAVQFTIQGALQQWLGELIQVGAVEVRAVDSSLEVTVQYMVRQTEEHQVLQLSREV